jgi:hypothetical protein
MASTLASRKRRINMSKKISNLVSSSEKQALRGKFDLQKRTAENAVLIEELNAARRHM